MATAQTSDTASEHLDADIEKNRDIAAFSYILIFAPVLLITRRDSAFIKHHALQALYLGFFLVLFMILPGKLSYLNIIVAAAALMGFLEAEAGHYYKMPIVSDMIQRNITLSVLWNKIKNFVLWIINVIKRMFTDGPGFAIRGTASAIEKARGVDALKVNAKVEDLKKQVQDLQQTIQRLEQKMEQHAIFPPQGNSTNQDEQKMT